MIKNLFFPDRIKGYYIFPTRILGFDIGKTTVKATQLFCKGKEISIEKCYEHPIQSTDASDYQERASAAIKVILEQAPAIDSIVSALPSWQAIFKELKLPFMGLDTIRKVVGYEVEPLLPFSLNDAVIDCIITKEIPEEKSSEVLVAAVQNQHMAQHLALFEMAGVNPERVTIDLFALYGLYSLIPAYANQAGGVVLLEIEPQSTRMAFIHNGQLRVIRTLQKGLFDQANQVAQTMGISMPEAYEHIIRFGLEPDHHDDYINAIKQAFTSFFNDIIFTLQSFVTQSKPHQSLNKIIIFGTSAVVKGLPQLITDLSHIKSEIFSINGLFHANLNVSSKIAIPQSNIISLAAALPNSKTAEFDLRQKEFARSQGALFMQQFLTGVVLLSLILSMLLGNAIWQIVKLKREAYQGQQEAVATLKEHIKNIPEEEESLEQALASAKSIVNQEERTWSAFSSAGRLRFLEYLLELTSKIDKSKLGLEVEKITMTPDTIILKAKVPGWPELRKLEEDLNQSKLFKVEPVPDPNFINTGMIIHIAKKPTARERP